MRCGRLYWPARRQRRLGVDGAGGEAFAEDCARAAVVISPREGPPACAATLIDRNAWRGHGAIALRWSGGRLEQSTARPDGYDRPWARAPRAPSESATATARPVPLNATPRAEDLEPGD